MATPTNRQVLGYRTTGGWGPIDSQPMVSVYCDESVSVGDPIKIRMNNAGTYYGYPLYGEPVGVSPTSVWSDAESPALIGGGGSQWTPQNLWAGNYTYDAVMINPFRVLVVYTDQFDSFMYASIGVLNATKTSISFGARTKLTEYTVPISSISLSVIDEPGVGETSYVGLIYVSDNVGANSEVRCKLLSIDNDGYITEGTEVGVLYSTYAQRAVWCYGRNGSNIGFCAASKSGTAEVKFTAMAINTGLLTLAPTGSEVTRTTPSANTLAMTIGMLDGDKFAVVAGSDYRAGWVGSYQGSSPSLQVSNSYTRLDTTGSYSGGESYLMAGSTIRTSSPMIAKGLIVDLFRAGVTGATDYTISTMARCIGNSLRTEHPSRHFPSSSAPAAYNVVNPTVRRITDTVFAIGCQLTDGASSIGMATGFGTITKNGISVNIKDSVLYSNALVASYQNVLPLRIDDEKFLLIYWGATEYGAAKIFALTDRPNLVGVAIDSGLGTRTIVPCGGLCSGLSGLKPGREYFINAKGKITDQYTPYPVGRAISTTQLMLYSPGER